MCCQHLVERWGRCGERNVDRGSGPPPSPLSQQAEPATKKKGGPAPSPSPSLSLPSPPSSFPAPKQSCRPALTLSLDTLLTRSLSLTRRRSKADPGLGSNRWEVEGLSVINGP